MTVSRRLLQTTCLAAALLSVAGTASANPLDGVVSAGNATISSSGSKLDVLQQSDRAVIDWRSFDIAPGEWTEFHQPSASSLTVNRVNSDHASDIGGRLTANGNLVILNQNGILFGAGAQVDVNGLIATTADIDNENVMSGSGALSFDKAGNPDAAIINDGTITAHDAGLVGLVAPNVVNNGTIRANLGRVNLASGDTVAVDLYGDGLMKVAVSDDVKSQLVSNSGVLESAGGTVALTAAAGGQIVNSLIVAGGEIKAPSVSQKNGHIIIAAEGTNAVAGNVTANKGKKQGASYTIVSGTLDVSGLKAGESGGSVKVTGDNIALLSGSVINASGSDGASNTTQGLAVSAPRVGAAGGDIQIGGDYLGSGDMGTASNLYVDQGALILNDSIRSGDAGRTILWSDDTTDFYGTVYARALGGQDIDGATWNATAGGNTGNGGFLETSGHAQLNAGGSADLTASNGDRGTYFLDPANITVYGNFAPNYGTVILGDSATLASNLKLWLDASDTANVNLAYNSLNTTANGTLGNNTITVSANTGLVVGARIRLGAAGSVTAASTVGADTYTINAISGTTITLTSNLTSNYTTSAIYQGYASQWTDKSGQGNNATQATAASRPLYVTNSQNGRAVLVFDGTNDGLSVNLNFLAGTSNTNFVVARTTTYSNIYGAVTGSSGAGSLHVGYTNAATYRENYWGNDFAPAVSSYSNSSSANILAFQWNQGGSKYIYANGHLESTTTGAGTITAMAGGGTIAGNVTGLGYWGGSLSEMAMYTTALSANAYALMNQYQSAKWGININPTGAGATEAAKAMASDGYSVFTTRYLERLSQSANISLQATTDISLDLQGDTLNLANNRDITLTAGNNIASASAGTITTNGTGSILFAASNNITLAHDINLNAAGTGNITLRSNNVMSFTNGVDFTTQSGNIILNADRNADRLGGISLTDSTITTNGGYFVAGGGNGAIGGTNSLLGDGDGTGADDAFAYGNNGHGVLLSNTVINATNIGGTSTGAIIVNGAGTYATGVGNNSYGISIAGTSALTADTGKIKLTGLGGNGEDENYGINASGSVIIKSTKGAITLTGTGGTAGTATSESSTGLNLSGLQISSLGTGSDAATITLTGTAGVTNGQQSRGVNLQSTTLLSEKGAVTVNGTGKGTSSSSYGVYSNGSILRSTGTATIDVKGQGGSTSASDLYIAGTGNIIGGATATGNITLTADSITLAGLSVQTSQNVTVKTRTASGSIGIGGGIGTLGLTDAYLAMFLPSGKLIIGDTASGTGDLVVDSWDLSAKSYNVEIYGNDITFQDTDPSAGVDYAMRLGTANFFAYARNNGGDLADLNINGAIDKTELGTSMLDLRAENNITAVSNIGSSAGLLHISLTSDADNNGVGDIIMGGAILNSANGNIALNRAVTLNGNLTLAAGTGALTAASTINGAYNLTAGAASMSFANALGGSTALHDVSLTSIGSLNLPSITAGSILARTTGATADLSIAVGKTITGNNTGNAVTLVTRHNFINNAGANAVSTPSGRWLIYVTDQASLSLNGMNPSFDRYTCGYSGTCPTPGAGNGLLYTYTPVLTVTPGAVSVAYTETPVFTYSVSGYLGGELSMDTITGSPTYTTGFVPGRLSGLFNITTGANTLLSALGYGFTYTTRVDGLRVAAPVPKVVVPNSVIRVSQLPSLNSLAQSGSTTINSTKTSTSSQSSTSSGTQKSNPENYKGEFALEIPETKNLQTSIPGLTVDPELQRELKLDAALITSSSE
ncbi:MAG: filamentous hemagglutinin N-terminal protein [Micavibrio sp.]|nr:filamentous hemagglutinin N-terminal protein [Micavibrio sp.]